MSMLGGARNPLRIRSCCLDRLIDGDRPQVEAP